MIYFVIKVLDKYVSILVHTTHAKRSIRLRITRLNKITRNSYSKTHANTIICTCSVLNRTWIIYSLGRTKGAGSAEAQEFFHIADPTKWNFERKNGHKHARQVWTRQNLGQCSNRNPFTGVYFRKLSTRTLEHSRDLDSTRFYKRCSALSSCRTLHANKIQTFVRCGFTFEKCVGNGIVRASVRGVAATLEQQIRKPLELCSGRVEIVDLNLYGRAMSEYVYLKRTGRTGCKLTLWICFTRVVNRDRLSVKTIIRTRNKPRWTITSKSIRSQNIPCLCLNVTCSWLSVRK